MMGAAQTFPFPLWLQCVPMTVMAGYIIFTFFADWFTSGRRPGSDGLTYSPDEEVLLMMITSWKGCGPAYRRSYDLLLASLSPEQKKSFETRGWFDATGSHSKGSYKISAASSMNIFHNGHCYCAEEYTVPIFDKILTQKLMIEFDEKKFLKIANKF